MNVLGLVFSLLLILSYGFYASWDKHSASHRLRTTYLAHQKANRKLLNKYQSALYDSFGRKQIKKVPSEEDEIEDAEEKAPIVNAAPKAEQLDPNPECAKLNLWPLIQEGREHHPILYELAATMIRVFYSPFNTEKRFEYQFLDDLLSSAKASMQEGPTDLEKVVLSHYRHSYYKMLKGAKEWNLQERKGHPPFLDYFKAEINLDKICLFHSHPDLLTALLGPKVAQKLHTAIHQKEGPVLTEQLLTHYCNEAHQAPLEPEVCALLLFGEYQHSSQKKMLVATENQLSLRRKIYINKK